MENKLKVVTIGGGSSYTPELIEGIIKRYDTFPVSEYWLVDIEKGKEKLEIIANLAKRMVKKAGLPIKIHSTLDRREALKNADFVTTQLRVGLLDARELDETIPLKYGMIGQETNGAGGMFKAFRTIPILLDIAKDMEELCPNAFLINFTNPAGIVTEAILKHTNLKKVIGLCNVPYNMEKNFSEILGVDKSKITTLFGGLNHMVFALKVFLEGENVIDKIIESIVENESKDLVQNIKSKAYEPGFLRELKAIPCPYQQYYYKPKTMLDEELEEFENNNIRAQKVKEYERELFEEYKNPNLDIKPPQLEKRGGAYYSDSACNLMDSIYNDKKDIQVVNTKNYSTIIGLDYDSVIECSCVITKAGPIPLTIGKLPNAINGLIQQIKSFEIATIEAAITGNRDKALLALAINPLSHSDKLSKMVLDEMLIAHKEYLPNFFKED